MNDARSLGNVRKEERNVSVFSKHAIQLSRTGSVNADYLLVEDRNVFVPVLP